jgi:PIN domain nuclease of toxin-antitoxin system
LTDDVLLDTHIAIWLETGDERLRPATIELIEDCWRNRGTVLLSTVSVWEIAQLVYRGRIELVRPLEAWVERFVDRPGVEVLPLSHLAAARAYRLDDLEHSDPADRLLIATAIERCCPLVTYDARIARFSETHGGGCGFRVRA